MISPAEKISAEGLAISCRISSARYSRSPSSSVQSCALRQSPKSPILIRCLLSVRKRLSVYAMTPSSLASSISTIALPRCHSTCRVKGLDAFFWGGVPVLLRSDSNKKQKIQHMIKQSGHVAPGKESYAQEHATNIKHSMP